MSDSNWPFDTTKKKKKENYSPVRQGVPMEQKRALFSNWTTFGIFAIAEVPQHKCHFAIALVARIVGLA